MVDAKSVKETEDWLVLYYLNSYTKDLEQGNVHTGRRDERGQRENDGLTWARQPVRPSLADDLPAESPVVHDGPKQPSGVSSRKWAAALPRTPPSLCLHALDQSLFPTIVVVRVTTAVLWSAFSASNVRAVQSHNTPISQFDSFCSHRILIHSYEEMSSLDCFFCLSDVNELISVV